MRWGPGHLGQVQGWRVAGGLAVGSLAPAVPWRGVADVVGGYLDVFVLSVSAVQPVVGSPTVGLTLSWLLVGWLTYQHAHLLYPAEFEAVVDFRGFRVLTALGTLFFGVVVLGSATEEAVPVQVLSSPTAVVVAVGAGIVGGGILFGVYVRRWHPDSLYDEQSDFTAMLQGLTYEDDYLETLPDRWQSFYRSSEAMAYAMFPGIICVLVGLAGLVIHLFYPLPEAVFVVALVALRVRPETGPATGGVPRYEVDLRLVDAITGAARSMKGALMTMWSFLGMAVSGLLFFGFFVGFLTSVTMLPDLWAGDQVGRLALAVFALGTSLPAALLMGMYSLVHWVRQLERIEPYARYWEGADDEQAPDVEETALPTRPPGLLIPTHIPIVGIWVASAVDEWTESVLIWPGVMAVCSSVAVVVMGWGLLWTRQHHNDPQPLTHESRDLLVTLLILFGLTASLGTIDPDTLQLNTEAALVGGLTLLLLTAMFYFPDVSYWQRHQEGLRKLLGAGYFTLIVLLTISFVRFRFEDSTLIVGLLLGLAALYTVYALLDIYLERIAE